MLLYDGAFMPPGCVLTHLAGCRVDAALDIAPGALVGREVRVYWDDDDAWYLGTVSGFNAGDHMHEVLTAAHAMTPAPFKGFAVACPSVSS